MPIVLLALLCLSLFPAHAQTPPNLVKNPSFEEQTAAGFAANWNGGEFGKPGQSIVSDDAVAHTGHYSVRLGIRPRSFLTCAAAPIPVKPQTTYYISWWCKTEGMKQARAYMWLQTNQAQRVLADDSQSGTTGWTQRLAQYTTTEAETSLNPVVTTHDSGGEPCSAWFDDIGVYEGSFPPDLAALYRAYLRNKQGICESALLLSKTPALTLWADDLSARIYREDGLPDYAKPAPELGLSAARGEQAYAQVAVLPQAALTQVSLQPADLKGPAVIPAAQVQWWPVGYVNIKTARRTTTRKGLTPDPIMKTGPVDAAASQNTPFLISVTVPANAKPGLYKGNVAVLAGDSSIGRIPLSVRVHDFALPQDPTFRTLITYSPGSFRPWDKRPIEEIEHDIARVLFRHGVRGNGATAVVPAQLVDGKIVCDFRSFDQRIEWCLRELRFNAFFLGPMFGGGTSEGWEKHYKFLGSIELLSDDFNRLFPEYMRQIGAHLREKGWLDKAYLYLWDEPEQDYFDKVVALQKLALQGDPGFKIWETTSPNFKEFYGVVKAWSVPFSRPHFNEESVDARRAAGDEIWVYNIPATLEASGQSHRLWFWQAARYGAIGAQLWQTTFYNKIDPWDDITPAPWVTGRKQENLYHYDAGQAILLYPDKQGGEPYPSLRLKLIQKGLDDYEYLHLLQQRLTELARRQKVANPEIVGRDRMRALASKLVRDINEFDTDCRKMQQVRDEVAAEIVKAGR